MSEITKRALRDSLRKELETKPFDKITVRDITEACGVSRMTFYYHFGDIYDLIEYIMRQVVYEVDSGNKDAAVGDKLILLLERMRKNRKMIMELRASKGWPSIEKAVYRIADEVIKNLAGVTWDDGKFSDQEIQFAETFTKYGIVGVIRDWIDNGMKEEPAELVSMLSSVLRSSPDFTAVVSLRRDSTGSRLQSLKAGTAG